LFYGFKTDDCTSDCPAGNPGCNLPDASSNAYAGSEDLFRQTPASCRRQQLLARDHDHVQQSGAAQAIIDHGVGSDGACPTQTVWLAKSSDIFRNIRYLEFDNAIFDARVTGDFSIVADEYRSAIGLTTPAT